MLTRIEGVVYIFRCISKNPSEIPTFLSLSLSLSLSLWTLETREGKKQGYFSWQKMPRDEMALSRSLSSNAGWIFSSCSGSEVISNANMLRFNAKLPIAVFGHRRPSTIPYHTVHIIPSTDRNSLMSPALKKLRTWAELEGRNCYKPFNWTCESSFFNLNTGNGTEGAMHVLSS